MTDSEALASKMTTLDTTARLYRGLEEHWKSLGFEDFGCGLPGYYSATLEVTCLGRDIYLAAREISKSGTRKFKLDMDAAALQLMRQRLKETSLTHMLASYGPGIWRGKETAADRLEMPRMQLSTPQSSDQEHQEQQNKIRKYVALVAEQGTQVEPVDQQNIQEGADSLMAALTIENKTKLQNRLLSRMNEQQRHQMATSGKDVVAGFLFKSRRTILRAGPRLNMLPLMLRQLRLQRFLE